MINLKSELEKLFADRPIVTLKEMTQKIALISKVRISKKRTFSDYDEISLNNIDAHGCVYVAENAKQYAPANEQSIQTQSLHPHDIIMHHRGKVSKIARVGNNYKRAIVGNNSMIRIQFSCKYPNKYEEQLSYYVFMYLQHPLVLEYINNFVAPAETPEGSKRKFVTAQFLENLPIPALSDEELENKLTLLAPFVLQRMDLLHSAKEMHKLTEEILQKQQERLYHDSIEVALNSEQLDNSIQEDREKLDEFSKVYESLLSIKSKL